MKKNPSLKKALGLVDVFAICTGAMFSSGFFILPGIAAAQTGNSVLLAYFIAGLMMIPAMLSQSELATAMPRAGGSYYFIDRALGPLLGTAGGLGTWLALVLKSAFALVGVGAYLSLFVELPIKTVALVLTVLFCVINILGAKESSGVQRLLVGALLLALTFFTIQGSIDVVQSETAIARLTDPDAFALDGLHGILGTVGLVFVSYAGLTKVASVAEEVERPERNIPLGMALALVVATMFYVVGVGIVVAVVEPDVLHGDLAPIATAAEAFMGWLPAPIGLGIVTIAALAAFASTGNAGILAASRYPLAMARDKLVPNFLGRLSKAGTPLIAIVVTSMAMAVSVVALDVAALAKLASAFQLILFAMLSLCVIIMRESQLDYYQPGFKSPLYPWMQIAGIVLPFWLLWEMGAMALGFPLFVIAVGAVLFLKYAASRVTRRGAIRHVFARLGTLRHDALDHELRRILSEQEYAQQDGLDEILARADHLDFDEQMSFEEVVHAAATALSRKLNLDPDDLASCFLEENRIGMMPLEPGAAVPHHLYHGLDAPHALVVHVREGVPLALDERVAHVSWDGPVFTFVFLLSPDDDTSRHYRLVANIATRLARAKTSGYDALIAA